MSNEVVLVLPDAVPACREADTDSRLVELWLHGRPTTTQRVYRSDVDCFLATAGKALQAVTLGDLQSFADSLEARSLMPATRHRMLAAVKSLFSFAHRLGYVALDVARPLRLPPLKDVLAERILSEAEVQRMLVLERHPRNHAILYLLYAAGVRVSECCGLRWRDLVERTGGGGQVTVFGKGGKTRVILLPAPVWSAVTSLRGNAGKDAPVFRSRRGGHLHPSQVLRVVKAAAKRAGIEKAVSPHFFRHAHCSHALERGAPIHLVQTTCGHASVATTGKYLHARPTESSSTYLPL
jgi:integrase/recombinase XerD